MAEYYIDFDMERNHNEDVKFRLKLTEYPDIGNNNSRVTADVQYKNTSEETIRGYDIDIKIVVNGTTLYNETRYDNNLFVNNGFERLWNESTVISHDANGNGSLSVSVEIKADKILLTQIHLTKGSASFSGSLTPIDLSAPVIRDLTVSANRYGVDAGANFIVEHSSYSINNIEFVLYGLTHEQADARYGKYTQADSSNYIVSADGTYSLVLKKSNGLSQLCEVFFDLDPRYDCPLNTGTHYSYSLTVTAKNGKSTKSDGSFYVPQKVTGISCVNKIEVCPGDNIELECSAIPSNAEDTSLIFVSSDIEVATISPEGVLTGINTGTCFITVTTVDGNYTAECMVYVSDTERYPELNAAEDYLSAFLIRDISSAILFLRKELTNKNIDVPDFSLINAASRKTQLTHIIASMISVESACRILEESARLGGIQTNSLPVDEQIIDKENTGWIIVVNNWISFLNELHAKLNGG